MMLQGQKQLLKQNSW